MLSQANFVQLFVTVTLKLKTVLSAPAGELITVPPETAFAPVPILTFNILRAGKYST
jgi:hypothetical protein